MKTKKILSVVLALVMVFSLSITAFAADKSTNVTYVGNGTESYTVTVPASITVNAEGTEASGEVTVNGTWASNRHLTVSLPETVTLVNSINANDTKVLDVTFTGIDKVGNNCVAIAATDDGAHATLTVENIEDALFGIWTGSVSYTVTMANVAQN